MEIGLASTVYNVRGLLTHTRLAYGCPSQHLCSYLMYSTSEISQIGTYIQLGAPRWEHARGFLLWKAFCFAASFLPVVRALNDEGGAAFDPTSEVPLNPMPSLRAVRFYNSYRFRTVISPTIAVEYHR
jgi:hypothetical protein